MNYINKYALCALCVLCLASSCEDRLRTDEPAGMSFRATAELPTRAATSTLDGNAYTVHASAIYHYPGETAKFHFGSSIPLVLDWSDATKTFVATGYVYPLAGTMDFAAYAVSKTGSSPNSVSIIPTSLTSTSSTFTSIVFDLTTSDGSCEVAYADRVQGVTCSAKTSEPLLHFHHPQANLRFCFETADEASCDHVVINWVKINNVIYKGKCTVNLASGEVSWTGVTSTEEKEITVFRNMTIPKETLILSGWEGLYIPPQTVGSPQIIVNYTMKNGDALDDSYTSSNHRTMNYVAGPDILTPAGGKWLSGYQYNYKIKVYGNCQMELVNVGVYPIVDGATGTMEI